MVNTLTIQQKVLTSWLADSKKMKGWMNVSSVFVHIVIYMLLSLRLLVRMWPGPLIIEAGGLLTKKNQNKDSSFTVS